MFDHVTIRVSDRAASESFYTAVLSTLGIDRTGSNEWFTEWNQFSLGPTSDVRPVTRRLHVGFAAPSRDHVDEFWRTGTKAGYRSAGAPGERQLYLPDYYGAFLLDPDGNSVEAVHYGDVAPAGSIDHLWIRVGEVGVARRFYEVIAPHVGIRLIADAPEFVRFQIGTSSFTLVSGTPTEHVHIAFPATDNATVKAFHEAAMEAGYRDNGGPGLRPENHPGYYGAFVHDPDGNNIEAVHHNRG